MSGNAIPQGIDAPALCRTQQQWKMKWKMSLTTKFEQFCVTCIYALQFVSIDFEQRELFLSAAGSCRLSIYPYLCRCVCVCCSITQMTSTQMLFAICSTYIRLRQGTLRDTFALAIVGALPWALPSLAISTKSFSGFINEHVMLYVEKNLS